MTQKTKERMICALENAATMIEGHVEVGLNPEDINEVDKIGMYEYEKACRKAAKLIMRIANKYK
jgi:hypothetical protein